MASISLGRFRTLPQALALLSALSVFAAFPAAAHAEPQTTIAASLYGSFSPTTTGNGTVESPSNQAGGLLEFRYIANPLVGYELNYSFNRANQSYNLNAVKANAHEFGADWVVSLPVLNFRPFALAGVGVIDFRPAGDQTDVEGKARPVFVYGAGVDWGLLPHIGLRAQFRGNLYHAPDMLKTVASTNAFTRNSQPMIGVYLRF